MGPAAGSALEWHPKTPWAPHGSPAPCSPGGCVAWPWGVSCVLLMGKLSQGAAGLSPPAQCACQGTEAAGSISLPPPDRGLQWEAWKNEPPPQPHPNALCWEHTGTATLRARPCRGLIKHQVLNRTKPRVTRVSVSPGSLLSPALAGRKGLTHPVLSLSGGTSHRGTVMQCHHWQHCPRRGRAGGQDLSRSKADKLRAEEENRDKARQKQTRKTSDTYFWGKSAGFWQDRSGRWEGIGA